MALSNEEAQRRLEKLTANAWNASRPSPVEPEFKDMTPLFRERLCAFTFSLLLMTTPPVNGRGADHVV